MSETVTIAKMYEELKALRKDVTIVKYAMLPEVKVSDKERRELNRIFHEMEQGEEKSFSEIISK